MRLDLDPQPSTATTVAFVALVAMVVAAAVTAVARAAAARGADKGEALRLRNRAAAVLGAYLALSGGLAAAGLLAITNVLPPPIMVLVGATFLSVTALGLSRFGRTLATGLPVAALVGFQAFRLPLEILLHRLFSEGVLPPQMTYSGMNFDILTGATAIPVALAAGAAKLPRFALALWNAMGLFLLLVIVTVAILSAPLPLRVFLNEPANAIVMTFPYVWLPTVLVQAAWLGHLLLWRRLVIDRRGS